MKIHRWLAYAHPSHWSITTRLAVTYALSAFSLLALTTFFLYWIFISRLMNDDKQFLLNKILVLQQILQTAQQTGHHQATALREEILLEPSLYHYYVRLIDNKGQIISETPTMRAIIPISAFAGMQLQSHKIFETTYSLPDHPKKKQHYLLMIAANAASSKAPIQYIQVAKDITAQREMVHDYRIDLLTVLFMGIIITLILSILVTRHGLKPLRDMTASTQRITLTQIQARLSPTSWPSELSELAGAFNNMLDRIEEGFIRLSHFSGDLAHELRTPINNLMGEAELALSRNRSNEEYRQVLESSMEELQRISHIIENLLFLARAENPKGVITRIAINIEQVFEEISDFYEAAAAEQGITILRSTELGLIQADPIMLRQAISNLISNALQHTEPGGSITLQVNRQPHQVEISITDTGTGIEARHLPHLFDRFYRADSARSANTGGTGLGLAIVKSIMDMHQGQVVITSQPGVGTTVTLIFPLTE